MYEKQVLVTGVSGFTGSNLAKALVRNGDEVYGFVRPSSRLNGLQEMGIHIVKGDLTEANSVEEAVKGMDIVYHIAASYRESGLPSSEYYKVNVGGTRLVLEAAFKHGVKRVVHCSTVGVHGHVENPPADENAPFNAGDLYQETKIEGEKVAREYMQKGLSCVIFRPVGIYGPGDRRFLKLFKAIKQRRFIMFGDGEFLYHLTFIDDLVRGIIVCGESEKASGETFIIAGEKATTLNELVALIADTLHVKKPGLYVPFWILWTASVLCEFACKPFGINPPLFRRRADFFRKDRSFNASKIEMMLGFKPSVSLEEGLRRTADWYRKENLI
jgi:nucleoside-diphosphate-sugar epimerase